MSNRRKSLGPLSTNRRVSIASGYDAISKQSSAIGGSTTRTNKQRQSMAPRVSYSDSSTSVQTSGRRKSDVMNSRFSTIPAPVVVKTDQRPIGDKTYFNSSVKKLYNFLQNNGYEFSIKLKDLSRPSAKDFNNIMTFLLRKVDPNFQSPQNANVTGRVNANVSKFEDEVSSAFRNLGYPFNISKTALVAAGSTQTWPTLLLAITWLIELLELTQGEEDYCGNLQGDGLDPKNEAGSANISQQSLEARTDKAFLRYSEMSYGSFLHGDDEQFELLEKGFLDYFERDNMVIEQEFERITEINAAILGQIEDLGKEVGE